MVSLFYILNNGSYDVHSLIIVEEWNVINNHSDINYHAIVMIYGGKYKQANYYNIHTRWYYKGVIIMSVET